MVGQSKGQNVKFPVFYLLLGQMSMLLEILIFSLLPEFVQWSRSSGQCQRSWGQGHEVKIKRSRSRSSHKIKFVPKAWWVFLVWLVGLFGWLEWVWVRRWWVVLILSLLCPPRGVCEPHCMCGLVVWVGEWAGGQVGGWAWVRWVMGVVSTHSVAHPLVVSVNPTAWALAPTHCTHRAWHGSL